MTNDPHELAKQLLKGMYAAPPETTSHGISAPQLELYRAQRQTRAVNMWLSRFAPTGTALPDIDPAPFTVENIKQQAQARLDGFLAMLDTLYSGDRILAWEACGKPKALRHWAGLDAQPITGNEWLLEMWFECGDGRRPVERGPDGRTKAVMDQITREVWPSVGAAAEAIGTSRVYLSQHLNGRVKAIKGRIFQYVE